MSVRTSASPIVTMKIAGEEVGTTQFVNFTWKAFVNGGYVVRGKLIDPYLHLFQRLVKQGHLPQARRNPLVVEFKIGWGYPNEETPLVQAIVTDLEVEGTADWAAFDFVAIDPPSWYLNAGDGSGKVYRGKVSEVIQQVVAEYAPSISLEITQTRDDPNGTWAMMRQDPKTFIKSLLDWSSSLTPKKTHWMVASRDDKLLIKEQADFLANGEFLDDLRATIGNKQNDLLGFQLLSNNSVTLVQTRLLTQGISAISGKYIDRRTERDRVEIRDDNTANKVNANIDSQRGYAKPNEDWSTNIISVPELNGGELGVQYIDYVDGRARNLYLSMLPMVMRMRCRIPGNWKFHDGTKLGVSTIQLTWKDNNNADFFLGGKWLVYGWEHNADRGRWTTDLYLYRIDHDAAARKV